MKLLSRSAPLLLLVLSACASTPAPTPSQQADAEPKAEQKFRTGSEAEAAADADDLICRTERKIGSRMDTKSCATRAEWERIREASTQDYGRAATRGQPIKPGG